MKFKRHNIICYVVITNIVQIHTQIQRPYRLQIVESQYGDDTNNAMFDVTQLLNEKFT